MAPTAEAEAAGVGEVAEVMAVMAPRTVAQEAEAAVMTEPPTATAAPRSLPKLPPGGG